MSVPIVYRVIKRLFGPMKNTALNVTLVRVAMYIARVLLISIAWAVLLIGVVPYVIGRLAEKFIGFVCDNAAFMRLIDEELRKELKSLRTEEI